jgi:(1->4)-alpha-D-glucan 1-alpha-D-glucosylmutase
VRPAPTATYRLQLHADFPLEAARRLVPYLGRLGISHVYASPILAARADSRHGYDVVDPTRLDPKLGTPAELRALARTLDRRRMGLLVDLVPNHMSVASENPFWEDVLQHGEASRHARWFDVAWRSTGGRRIPLRLPVLGDRRARVVERGEIRLVLEHGRVRVAYFDARFPLDPATLGPIVGEAALRLGPSRSGRELAAIATALGALPPRDGSSAAPADRTRRAAVALARLEALVHADRSARAGLERTLAAVTGATLARLLELQVYRLVYWRRAAGDVNYRRFFAVSELIALRMEDPIVFAATHARILGWVGNGLVDGLRIDHVDGLADPRGYLVTLRRALDERGARDAFVLVEKILTGDEQLRAEWPVAGTTGYEFSNALDTLFVDPGGLAAITQWYRRNLGAATGFRAVAWAGKREMADSWLRPDVRRLAELFAATLRPRDRRPHARPAEVEAIVELLVAMPVYRTYVDARARSPLPIDRTIVGRALADARRRGRASPAALRAVANVLLHPAAVGTRAAFVRRFQQTSSAVMAKGVEDTALYRWIPLAARNEVGADPSGPPTNAVGALHAFLATRARRTPNGLSATTTHDSKRSADLRARLHVLSEMPARWTACVARWRARHRRWRRRIDGRLAPDAVSEYLFYQTAVGLWPAHAGAPLDEIRERIRAYALKAAREAGVRTTWLEPVPAFEAALDAFVVRAFASPTFRAEAAAMAAAIARSGLWTALSGTVVHLTAPGVPDLYQGDELWNFSVVDPDNRRDVDYAVRAERLAWLERRPVDAGLAQRLVAEPDDGRMKLHVIRSALGLRRRAPAVFRGAYVPLTAGHGALRRVFAFARVAGRSAAIVVVPRLVLGALHGRDEPPIGARTWGTASLTLPSALSRGRLTNVFTGERLDASRGVLPIAAALASFPVALLWSD